MEKEIETVFTVVCNTDGTFSVSLEQTGEVFPAKRQATTFDVYTTLQAILKEIDAQMLIERLVNALNPTTPAIPDVVKEKLKERGITPQEPA
jgi:hypothetical protein